MKRLLYYLIKCWISLGLFFYYKKIKIIGIENIPKDKPILFLSNHQNALLDVLLIATNCNRKPWFLARSDIFKNSFFSRLFRFLQMMPIYRLRDGKASLANNEAIFNECGTLLNHNEAILIFPEANHNLKRRVRPLSKGFTRILFKTLTQDPNCDIYLIPIGQNYQFPTDFGDSAALYFGETIRVQTLLSSNENASINNLKATVSMELKQLTTHIEKEKEYELIIKQLDAQNVDYSNPESTNNYLNNAKQEIVSLAKIKVTLISRFSRVLFYLINLPIVFIWRILLKPKVPEAEFIGTFRFGFAMVVYPNFYLLCFLGVNYAFNMKTACLIVVGHAVLNLMLVKFGIATSSHQRK